MGCKCGNGETRRPRPFGAANIDNLEASYEELPGWTESTYGVGDLDKLPANARRYLDRLAEICGVPIDMISTGPDRDETIVLRHPFLR